MQYKITVGNLLLQETGTYENQFLRPYSAHVSPMTLSMLENRLDQFHQPGQQSKIGAGLLGGVAGQIIQPRSDVGNVVGIPQGWAERRLRFVLQIDCDNGAGGMLRYYVQGYTSHMGVIPASHAMGTGHVDPNMMFYVNSIIGTITAYRPTPMGMVPETRVVESSQVINGLLTSNLPGSGTIAMRPFDVYTDIQGGHVSAGFRDYVAAGSYKIYDGRQKESMEAQRSKRVNNMPGSFLGEFVTAQMTSKLAGGMIDGPQDQLGICRQAVFEHPLVENPFFAALFKVRGMQGVTMFSLADLCRIDPTLNPNNDPRLIYRQVTGVHLGAFHQQGTGTAEWGGADLSTISAISIINGVSSIMFDLFVTNFQFTSSNMMGGNQIISTIEGAESFVQGGDMRAHYATLIQRIEREVLQDITTQGGQAHSVPFSLQLKADLFSETWINLTIAGVQFIGVLPSFCDALVAPTVADDVSYRGEFATQLEKVFNSMNGGSASQSGIIANF